MTNHLTSENSPYLLQHSNNPVDWYPWGSEALEKARIEDQPIFLSIGYAACHWCHVMAHESFEDPDTAALMNAHFVNIKVDREERPDLDSIYMKAVVALTGRGGWPMSVFLTPDGIPFFGGTYFPPRPRYGMPAFKDLLVAIGQAWQNDRKSLLTSGQELLQNIQNSYSPIHIKSVRDHSINPAIVNEAATRLIGTYDRESGGWGKAPKFPQPMAIEFLLRRACHGDQQSLPIVCHALDTMAKGGLYDILGGGFARYSTDNEWLVPHFEKMLYDNAQLARAYLHAFLLTGNMYYRHVCAKTLDFLIREMMQSDADEKSMPGGFFSSLDADSEGVEGKYYLWTASEIRNILKPSLSVKEPYVDLFFETYAITDEGNFEGKVILQRAIENQELVAKYGLNEEAVAEQFSRIHDCLFQARSKRVRPATDNKILTSWNAYTSTVFAEAARYLKRSDYLQIARKTVNFILTELYEPGCLYRSWRDGNAKHPGYLEDYAAFILCLLELYQSDPDPRWYAMAQKLEVEMQENFLDLQIGFFDTRNDQNQLIVRPKDLQDNATPCGNSLAALALLKLDHYSGGIERHEQAVAMLVNILPQASRYPTAFANWLSTADFALSEVREVAILGNLELTETKELVNSLWQKYQPDLIVACSTFPPPANAPALLRDRPLQNGLPTAYVCQDFTCRNPVNSAQELTQQLAE
jgi:uncharacterized protein